MGAEGRMASSYYRAVTKILQLSGFYYTRNERYASLIVQFARVRPGARSYLLDVGCGLGGVTAALTGSFDVLGVDLRREALMWFFDPSISRLQARAEFLPIRTGSIDVGVAISLVEHLPDQRRFFREMARVLRPDGVALLQIPEPKYPIEPHTKWPLLYLWNESRRSRILDATGYGDVDLSTSLAKVLRLAVASSFAVEKVLPIWHFRLARLLGRPMGYFIVLRNVHDQSPDR